MKVPPSRRHRNRSAHARLLTEPRRFSFDAAVRVLLFRRRRADPAESIQFGSVAGSAFPGAEVTEVQDGPAERRARMTVALIGLTGPSGVLPRHYSEAVVSSGRGRSFSLADFLQLISQRMVAAFAVAGMKYRPHRAADAGVLRDEARGDGDRSDGDRSDGNRGDGGPVAGALLALTGYGLAGMAERLPTGTAPLQHYAGLFSARPRSADRLEALASDWLQRSVVVEQFVGAWLPVPPDQRTALPIGLAPGAFHQLGHTAAIGVRAWDQQAGIVLRIGPLDLAFFNRLLPDGVELQRLVSLVRAYVGFEVGFAVNLVLQRDAVPPISPGVGAPSAPRLGWNTWLPNSAAMPRRADAADAVFLAELVEGQASAVMNRKAGFSV